jgi:hypothetical protein
VTEKMCVHGGGREEKVIKNKKVRSLIIHATMLTIAGTNILWAKFSKRFYLEAQNVLSYFNKA